MSSDLETSLKGNVDPLCFTFESLTVHQDLKNQFKVNTEKT